MGGSVTDNLPPEVFMSLSRHVVLGSVVLGGLLGLLGSVGAAMARALPVDDLPALSASVPAELLLRLAERRGLDRALGAEDRAALAAVGLGSALIDRLALLSKPSAEVDGVAYAVVDGVIRVQAEGPAPSAPAVLPTDDREMAEEGPDAEPEARYLSDAAAPADQLPGSSETALDAAWSNPYPAGAFGATVGAVFIPARFGDSPSAFGRTIVATSGVTTGCHAPCASAADGVFLRGAAVAEGQRRPDAWPEGFIPLRTSRGTLWVPN